MKIDLILGLIFLFTSKAFCFWAIYWICKSDLETSKPLLILFIICIFFTISFEYKDDGKQNFTINKSLVTSKNNNENRN